MLSGGNRSLALGINSSGHVVGTSRTTSTGGARAFVYFNEVDGMIDLNTVPLINGSGWVFTSAEEINNSGYIVGRGTRNGYPTAFGLYPIFE